ERTVSKGLRALGLESIRNKLLAFAVLATLIPSLATVWVSYVHSQRSLTEKITGEQHSLSAQASRELDLWLKERLYDLRVFASSYEVSENLERIPRTPKGGEPVRQGPAYGRLRDYLNSVRDRFAAGGPGGMIVVTADGTLLAGSGSGGAAPMAARLPPESVRLLFDRAGSAVRYRGFEGEETVGTLEPVPRLSWAVVATIPGETAYRQATRLRNLTVLIVAALLLGVGLLAYLLGVLIVRPLDRLTTGAAKVAAGDLAVDLPVVSGGEVGSLTEVFNDMVARLRDGRRELERLSVT